MQDGQQITLPPDQGLTLIDPFAHSPDEIFIHH
jgi:hypothetical protein